MSQTGVDRSDSYTQDWRHIERVARDETSREGQEIPTEIIDFVADQTLVLDGTLFSKCLASAPAGSAPGPGGCTNAMLKVCRRCGGDAVLAARCGPGKTSQNRATMTALQKRDGGVRGIATGTSFRRMIAKTLARQYGKVVRADNKGDPLMPLLFSLAIHDALLAVQAQVREGEVLFAFLDDVNAVTGPNRTRDVYDLFAEHLWRVAGIQMHIGQTRLCNKSGISPPNVEGLGQQVWSCEGIKVLGTPVGTDEFMSDVVIERARAGCGRPLGGCPICTLLSNVQAHVATIC